jgi:predicted RNase H-like HicB family nuclease
MPLTLVYICVYHRSVTNQARFECAEVGIAVTFPDMPEAIACSYSEAEAVEYAVDAIATMFTEDVKRRRAIPPAAQSGVGYAP